MQVRAESMPSCFGGCLIPQVSYKGSPDDPKSPIWSKQVTAQDQSLYLERVHSWAGCEHTSVSRMSGGEAAIPRIEHRNYAGKSPRRLRHLEQRS
jgi:hypothetical protein